MEILINKIKKNILLRVSHYELIGSNIEIVIIKIKKIKIIDSNYCFKKDLRVCNGAKGNLFVLRKVKDEIYI